MYCYHILISSYTNIFRTFPNKFNLSLRYLDANIADTRTLNAPSGVTRDAGANAYAVKFAASPIPTVTFVFAYNMYIYMNIYEKKSNIYNTQNVFHNIHIYVLDNRPAHQIHSFK